MTDNTQPEALRLANELAQRWGENMVCPELEAAAELRRQHARIAELEAQLEAIGAGGVSGSLMGKPQEMPDLTTLTERGAKAWAGVDAQGLREGVACAGSEPVAGIYQLSPPASAHDTITEVIKELRTYNPQADEQGGKFIHKGWANQLEAVAPPQISESDAAYWVRNRALILRAIEERGFRLVSSGGLFWLSGPSHSSPPEVMVGGWMPLIEAPNNEIVLVAAEFDGPGDWRIKCGYLDGQTAKWRVFGASWEPSHWMPLPPPPTSSADSRKGE